MRPDYLIVDGHSVIFAWPELRVLHERRTSLARDALARKLRDYQDWTGVSVVVVSMGAAATWMPSPDRAKFRFSTRVPAKPPTRSSRGWRANMARNSGCLSSQAISWSRKLRLRVVRNASPPKDYAACLMKRKVADRTVATARHSTEAP